MRIMCRVTKMMRALEHHCYEKRLRKSGMFTLRKRRLRKDLISVCKYLKDKSRGWSQALLSDTKQ